MDNTNHASSLQQPQKVQRPREQLADQLQTARDLQRYHGAGKAARYLRHRGFSLDAARWFLLRK